MKPNGHDESIAVKVEDGFVILATPHGFVKLDPQTGYEFGEAVARAAHEAKFGEAPDDEQYLASQVRARTTEQMRGKMVNRFALMIPSLLEQGKDQRKEDAPCKNTSAKLERLAEKWKGSPAYSAGVISTNSG